MDTEVSRIAPSIRRLLAAAIGVAFAWVLLALVMGFGSSDARAEETTDGGALSGLVSSVVNTTTNVVTDAAASTVGIVEHAASGAPAAPPVAAPVVAPIAQVVQATVQSVTGAVQSTVADGVAAPIIKPVVDSVAAVPVVGAVVAGVGLDTALPAVAETVDEVLVTVGAGVSGEVDGLTPSVPASPLVPQTGQDSVLRLDALTGMASFAGRTIAASVAAIYSSSPLAPLIAALSGEHPSPIGPASPADAASMGLTGAGPVAWGALALLPFVAYRAWMRRTGQQDDRVPVAPALSTDTSPD